MKLPSKAVFEILRDRGVDTLHHANTVLTSCQFILRRALASRGTLERAHAPQTPQASDEIDRELGIWFDVFLDSVDIHQRAKCANAYGPVLFGIDARVLREEYTGGVWVTKLNPTKWKGVPAEERWFQSKGELAKDFQRGTFDQMIVLRHCGGELPIGGHLSRIILDEPRLALSDIDLFSAAYGALKLAAATSGLKVPVQPRPCSPEKCRCRKQYRDYSGKALKAAFLPIPV